MDAILAALQHPLRRQILRAMNREDPTNPRDLAARLGKPFGRVGYHVTVLADCGALNREEPAARGSTARFYLSREGEQARSRLRGP